MLRAVGIARPVNQNERPVAFPEQRQDRFGRHRGKIFLLHDVGRERAGISVGAARRADQRQVCRLQPLGHCRRQRDAFAAAGRVIDDDGRFAGSRGVIEDQDRPDLADRRRAVALVAGELQDGRFIEIIAGKMLVDVGQDRVDFEERRDRVTGGRHFKAGVDGVGEVAGVAEHVSGGECRGVRRREGGKQRVAVAQRDAIARQRRHGRGRGVVDHAESQTVGHEQHDVMRPAGLGLRRGGRDRGDDRNGNEEKEPMHAMTPRVALMCQRGGGFA